MKIFIFKRLLFIALLIFFTGLKAYEPYHATITLQSVRGQVSAPNLVDLNRSLRTTALEQIFPHYTPTDPISLAINLRGLKAFTSFAANSTALVVNIPNAGITTSFDGGTRDQSLALFKQYIKEGNSLKKILKGYAKYSPIDPIVGNPVSLMAGMAESDYQMAKLTPLEGCDCSYHVQPIVHLFQGGNFYKRAFAKKYDTTSVTLPLRYSYCPRDKWALILDAPLAYNRNAGASSLYGSLGVGLKMPLLANFSLTPILRMGYGGSLDLVCAGSFVSAGITALNNIKGTNSVLTLTNYMGYFSSTNLWLTGVNFNYRIQNLVLKNGISLISCKGFNFFNRLIHYKIGFEDTYFKSKRLFLKHYDEISFSLLTKDINPYLDYDCLQLSFAYQFGQKRFKSYAMRLLYQF